MIYSDLGVLPGMISQNEFGHPSFFYISDITNSSSFYGKLFRQKSMLEDFRANVLKLEQLV